MPEDITNQNVQPIVTPPVVNQTVPTVNYEDLIAKARAEEKNKLYPQIEKLKSDLEQKTEKINSLLLSIAQKDEDFKVKEVEIAKLNDSIQKLGKDGEVIVEKDKTVKELQAKLDELTKSLEVKDNEFQSYKSQVELASYRKEKTKDIDESILDFVSGNSKEEIDASVEKAKAMYEKIASKLGTANATQQQQQQQPPVNHVPPVNMTNVGDLFKNVNPDEIMNMNPKEYAEWRKANGLK